jgi:hypothetical protein
MKILQIFDTAISDVSYKKQIKNKDHEFLSTYLKHFSNKKLCFREHSEPDSSFFCSSNMFQNEPNKHNVKPMSADKQFIQHLQTHHRPLPHQHHRRYRRSALV